MADVYEATTADRPYRRPFSPKRAKAELQARAGQLEPGDPPLGPVAEGREVRRATGQPTPAHVLGALPS